MNERIVAGLLGYLTLFTGAAAFLLSIFLCVAVTFEFERFGDLQKIFVV